MIPDTLETLIHFGHFTFAASRDMEFGQILRKHTSNMKNMKKNGVIETYCLDLDSDAIWRQAYAPVMGILESRVARKVFDLRCHKE